MQRVKQKKEKKDNLKRKLDYYQKEEFKREK